MGLFCWKCRSTFPEGVLVCVRCGVNLQTGEELAAKSAVEEYVPITPREKVLAFFADCMPGLFRPLVLLCSVLASLAGMGVIGMGLVVMNMGALLSGIPISACGLILHAQAVVWAITGQFWMLHVALVEFQNKHWGLFILLTLFPLAAGILALRLFVPVEP